MNQITQLMDTAVAPAMPTAEPSGGMIKSVLLSVHDDDSLDARVQVALSIARSCSAHLQLLQVVPVQAYTVVDTYGGAFVSGEILEALQEAADKVRLRIEKQLKIEDVSWNFEQTTSVVLAELLQSAAFADLVIMGREPHFHEFSQTGLSLLGHFICSARSPLLVPGDGKAGLDPFGKALIAWNGTIEAANAVREAMGLLKMAADVRVVRYTEDKELSLKDEQLLRYLSRHDIHAEIETHLPKVSISDDLIDAAATWGAEYLVMGGYSHSRAGEFLFGGVTRGMLRDCSMTLVMGH